MTFAYHGISRGELKAARMIGRSAKTEEHRFVRLPDLKEAGDLGVRFEDLPPTYIPIRNALFYSIAGAYAEEVGADYLIGGHNRDDLEIYRDTSSAFFEKLQGMLWASSRRLEQRRLKVLRPLKSRTKPQVIRLAASLGVPLELTWSCHRDGSTHCWDCEGCRSRAASFRKAGVEDPLNK
jgi:7-cyano-7-deazaguanine synthase